MRSGSCAPFVLLLAACSGPGTGSSAGSGTGSGTPEDHGIPTNFPQLTSSEHARARWAFDGSGYDVIPNPEFQDVADVPVTEFAESRGVGWDHAYGSYAITFKNNDKDVAFTIYLPSQEPGSYEVTGWRGEVLYTSDTSQYTTYISGGRGTVEIVGNNGDALWGRLSGRFCFTATPDVNCFSFYEGSFAALVTTDAETLDVKVPPDYPALSPAWGAHGTWRFDDTGYATIPNDLVSSVDELPVSEGVASYGAIVDPNGGGLYVISFADTVRDQELRINLSSLDPGTYDLKGVDHGEYYRSDGYGYTTSTEGGRGTVEILGNDGVVLWGTFSWRACFIPTPGANCFSLYQGEFAALVQLP